MQKSELLLPVGDMNMCLAAIHNGADAIYIGSPFFNARGRSKDHSLEEIKEIIELCHLYGVHVHIAFNILIFENELEKAFLTLKELIKLGPDALIIQDLGLASLVRKISKTQVIHGSTQMTVTNHEAINLLEDLDIKRFVLGRENSLSEIQKVRDNTDKELEVFVHGALCVAYSGQCFTSESLGGRSANRGQCAQSCRFEYELIVDGKTRSLDGKKYLVSPQDLCGISEVEKLQQMGIESFKVEGRLKSPEYVGVAARSYRKVIDGLDTDIEGLKNEMSLTYSRGLYSGWLNGVAHQELVNGEYQSHRGRFVGELLSEERGKLEISSAVDLKEGDGLFFIKDNEQHGSLITFLSERKKGQYIVRLKEKIPSIIGAKVYLNSRETLKKEIEQSSKSDQLMKKIDIKVKAFAKAGEKLFVQFSDGENAVSTFGEEPIEKSINRPVNKEFVEGELSKLGRTIYQVSQFELDLEDGLFLSQKELKKIKNNLVISLNKARLERKIDFTDVPFELGSTESSANIEKKLVVLVRTFEQLKALVDLLDEKKQLREFLDYVVLDYEFGKDFVPSVKLCKESEVTVYIATTRILKPNEYHNFTLIKRASPDGILVRNLGALNYFKELGFKLAGDFSLNAANSLTANYLLDKGLDSLCLSYDLSKERLDELLKNVDSSKIELTVYQYMPEFHMEHCVFAAFMSKGNSFRDCGKPCEKHEVRLKDMYGNVHEIKADQECRNTMFNARAQSALEFVDHWNHLGVSKFRFEALHESCSEFKTKVESLLSFFMKKSSVLEASKSLGGIESYGLSSGQLLKKRNYKDRKKVFKNQ